MTDAYYPERLGRKAALPSHDELLDIVRTIKDHRTLAREELLREHFEAHQVGGGKPPTSNDQNRAFNIGASVLFMMDFNILHDAANSLEGKAANAPWRDRVTVVDFVKEAFPYTTKPATLRNMNVNVTAKDRKSVV